MLTLVETTSKTTLDLRGDFHLLFIYFNFFSKIKFLFQRGYDHYVLFFRKMKLAVHYSARKRLLIAFLCFAVLAVSSGNCGMSTQAAY